jgi:hypothetical protein
MIVCSLLVHSAWDYSAWVRTYALYLEERLECFRVLKYDVESDPPVCNPMLVFPSITEVII